GHVLLVALLRQVDVEGLEQLAILVLGRDDLELVAQLLRQHLERRLVERLRDRRHLSQVEEDGHEVRRIRVDLLCEVRQRGTAAQAQRRGSVTAGDGDAAHGRSLHLLELCALRPLRLASASGTTAAATECALRVAATATGAARAAAGTTATGSAAGCTGSARSNAGTAAAGAGLGECGVLEHPGVGP